MLNGLRRVVRNGGRQVDRAILLVSVMLCSAAVAAAEPT
jgi:hypothetical protein